MRRPLIMVAPNGARKTQADHAALPVTLPQIIDTALACRDAGADALHLHVRDADGRHTLDPGLYAEALKALAEAVPSLPVQITTEAAGQFDVSDQLACLETLKPEWASVAIREMARDRALAARLYGFAAETGMRLQHILYDAEDAALLRQWQDDCLIPPAPAEAILVLGRYADGLPSDPAAVSPFAASLPDGTRWMLCAFGSAEHACLLEAARLGGDLRVGFENSLTAPDGTTWADNAASVAALREALSERASRQ